MKLRDHPIMSYRGYSVWPPIWVSRIGTMPQSFHGEVGNLRRARSSSDRAGRIFLTIEHEGVEYTGCVLMEYQFACESILALLQGCHGMSIEAIGSLDLPLAFGTFRKASGSQTWHFCESCSHWPEDNYEQRLAPPPKEPLCNQCKTLRGNDAAS
jgi:hypothetical protein